MASSRRHQKSNQGQPLLVGTTNIKTSELISKGLKDLILNMKY